MKISLDEKNKIATVTDHYIEIPQDALDMLADAYYNYDCDKIIIGKDMLADEFFDLSNGIAGEILQKFTNYHVKLAIIGDFSSYTSKALQDFMRESNQGNQIFFCATQQDAKDKLTK